MATIPAPATHAGTEGTLGLSYALLDTMIEQELAETFDLTVGDLVELHPDFAGSGSDVARLRYFGGLGAAASFTSMGGETDSITASSWTANYDTLTLGRHGLAFEESFMRRILQNDGVTLEEIAIGFAAAWTSLLRSLVCTQGATFATNAADDAATLDVDDIVNLKNLALATEGFDATRGLNVVLRSEQFGHLTNSMRAETALKFPEQFAGDQRLRSSAGYQGQILGMDFFTSKDVLNQNSDYYGFAYQRGCMVYGVADPTNLGDISDANPIYVPRAGLVITRETDGRQALKRIDGNSIVGVTSKAVARSPQWLLRSAQS